MNQQFGFGTGVAPVELVRVGGGGKHVRTKDGKSNDKGSKLKGEADREGWATVLVDVSSYSIDGNNEMENEMAGYWENLHRSFYTPQKLP